MFGIVRLKYVAIVHGSLHFPSKYNAADRKDTSAIAQSGGFSSPRTLYVEYFFFCFPCAPIRC